MTAAEPNIDEASRCRHRLISLYMLAPYALASGDQENLLKDAVGFATEHRFYLRKDGNSARV